MTIQLPPPAYEHLPLPLHSQNPPPPPPPPPKPSKTENSTQSRPEATDALVGIVVEKHPSDSLLPPSEGDIPPKSSGIGPRDSWYRSLLEEMQNNEITLEQVLDEIQVRDAQEAKAARFESLCLDALGYDPGSEGWTSLIISRIAWLALFFFALFHSWDQDEKSPGKQPSGRISVNFVMLTATSLLTFVSQVRVRSQIASIRMLREKKGSNGDEYRYTEWVLINLYHYIALGIAVFMAFVWGRVVG
ncbi:MAG: hypothetical protein M1820_006748 [Bogoriella megaspora]|nr:MAG: hypothetical protein M1820_006748 [Bogoriella megaspora]